MDVTATIDALSTQSVNYYQYRKRIHGSVTIIILLAYSAGFYLLIPEYAEHLSKTTTILIAASYLLTAAIFGFFIRKGIKDETKTLDRYLELQNEVSEMKA